ncbi:MAG: mevalonate kinase [Kiritimatiellae bacterium]|nr:mevalonate kinase [Kiritimatiellia bacterium]
MKAIAPGKLILTGEHAVVHGRPALVMAVDRYAETVCTAEPSGLVALDLGDLGERHVAMLSDLRALRQDLMERYGRFLAGDLPVREILRRPPELLQFALAHLIEELHVAPPSGLVFRIRSDIPIGCGMGSSAASVLSLLRAAAAELGADMAVDRYYHLALDAEKLQHGRPSGVDPCTCLRGGLLRFRQGHAEALPMPAYLPLFLVHTGAPETTTGECVEQVTRRFGASPIWDDFEAVARGMEPAVLGGDLPAIQALVRRNHRLLGDIGVVPARVAEFIARVEETGAAAKICGAGAVAGRNAGVVWVAADSPPLVICREFGYDLIPARGDTGGTRIA